MASNKDIEKRLWAAADQLWANSNLRPSEFSPPVLGLIFLRYADHKFAQAEAALTRKAKAGQGRRKVGKVDLQAEGVLYLPESARFSNLQKLPEGADLAKAVIAAMKEVGDKYPSHSRHSMGGGQAALFRLAWPTKGFSDSPEPVP